MEDGVLLNKMESCLVVFLFGRTNQEPFKRTEGYPNWWGKDRDMIREGGMRRSF